MPFCSIAKFAQPRAKYLDYNESGYSPAQILRAYYFDRTYDGAGQTIALVDAYGYDNIQSDLRVFTQRFDLPEADLTIDALGDDTTFQQDWAIETAMDVQWAHALAPGARLLLVLAASSSVEDLMTAVTYALSRDPDILSLSWGLPETTELTNYHPIFAQSRASCIAAVGDSADTPRFPSISPDVLAVGGTSLRLDRAGNRVGPESLWVNSGGGISQVVDIPAYQRIFGDINTLTGGYRGLGDVSFLADPLMGVAVYCTSNGAATGRWLSGGGTSLGAPAWAAITARINQAAGRPLGRLNPLLYDAAGRTEYQLPQLYFVDITTGANSITEAREGWNFCTGLGSPVVSSLIERFTAEQQAG